MIRLTLMALLGSSLTQALVVHSRFNGSAINFLPCDPTVSNCDNLKDNLVGCDLEACKATKCPDGSIAPILPGNCCPDTSLCPGMSCLAFLGFVRSNFHATLRIFNSKPSRTFLSTPNL